MGFFNLFWLLGLLLLPTQSLAQIGPPCDDRQKVLDFLLKEYGEQVIAYGVTSTSGFLQVLKSGPGSEKETWSIIYSRNADRACLLASGTVWREVTPELLGDDL